MDIAQARKLLGEATDHLSDEDVSEMIAMYRAIARIFIQRGTTS